MKLGGVVSGVLGGLAGWQVLAIKGGLIAAVVGGVWVHGYAFQGNRLHKKYLDEKNSAIISIQKEKDELVSKNAELVSHFRNVLEADNAGANSRMAAESDRLRKYYAAKFVLPPIGSGAATGRDFAEYAEQNRRAAEAAQAEIARLADEVIVAEEAALLCARGTDGAARVLREVEKR